MTDPRAQMVADAWSLLPWAHGLYREARDVALVGAITGGSLLLMVLIAARTPRSPR